jgi:hypothetical protein
VSIKEFQSGGIDCAKPITSSVRLQEQAWQQCIAIQNQLYNTANVQKAHGFAAVMCRTCISTAGRGVYAKPMPSEAADFRDLYAKILTLHQRFTVTHICVDLPCVIEI